MDRLPRMTSTKDRYVVIIYCLISDHHSLTTLFSGVLRCPVEQAAGQIRPILGCWQGGEERARQVRDLGEGSLPGHRRGRQ